MSTHAITLLGYAVIVAVGATLEVVARRGTTSVPTLDTLVRWTLRSRSGRIALLASWAWMGLHFLG
jgi:hypothetical protein